TVTSEYSPATKNALRRIRRPTATSSISTLIAGTPERSCRPGTCEVRVRRRPQQRTYSEASRRPLRTRSISDPPVVLDPAGASLQHEPLEVGQGLRDREGAGRRPPGGAAGGERERASRPRVGAEEGKRDGVAAQRLGTERRGGRVESLGVVRDERPRAPRRLEDRLPAAPQRGPRPARPGGPQRPPAVAQRR